MRRPITILVLALSLTAGLEPAVGAHTLASPWGFQGRVPGVITDICGFQRVELAHGNGNGQGNVYQRTSHAEKIAGNCSHMLFLTRVDAHSLDMQIDYWDARRGEWRFCYASGWQTRRNASASVLQSTNVSNRCGATWYVVWGRGAWRNGANDPWVIGAWRNTGEAHSLPI